MSPLLRSRGPWRSPLVALAIALAGPALAWGQAGGGGVGTVRGMVTRGDDGSPLSGVLVTVKGTGIATATNVRGRYVLDRVPAGAQTLVFRWLGYRPTEVAVTVASGAPATADAKLEGMPVQIGELVVIGASRTPERAVDAPAAVSVVEPRMLTSTSITGQAPLALANVPGVDLAQNGVNDFNLNARGFNSSLNRRILVLVDGRDVATAFLSSQEWNALPIPAEDIEKMELVRGPGSALYGANAYSGVLNITTPSAREVVGTKATVGGGELSSFKGDVRHAGLAGDGRVGYRLNLGYYRSDTWSRSRTLLDGSALRKEYATATDRGLDARCSVCVRPELRPLNGEVRDPSTGAISGDRDPIQNIYGSARLEYYANNGAVLAGEYGAAQVENEVAVTGIGRVQITKTFRPYARVSWANQGFNVMAYWNGRNTRDPQFALASGAGLKERSNIFHIEGQERRSFAGDRGRVIYGGSFRNYQVNTRLTLMGPADDDRKDYYYAAFGQLEYKLSDKVRAVGAARFDLGTLIDPQLSPKAALVLTPSPQHSIRFTVNRAFQTPNYSEYFLNVPAGAPANFTALETGLRASALGPALAGVPVGQLFDKTDSVPVRARGNSKLQVERVTGFEAGYRGDISRKAYVTLDLYLDLLRNFVTDLLPAVNPAFPRWTAPNAVPAPFRGALQDAVRNALLANPATALAGRGLTRLENGRTAIVLSYTNAGKVTQWGAEFGAGVQLSRDFRADGSISVFNYDVNDQAQGDNLLANTPSAKGNVSFTYANRQGFDASATFRAVKGYDWAAGVFVGYIEPQAQVDASVGYNVNNNFRVFATGMNIFDQQRYAIYGGSVNGRRILAGLTTRF